MANLTRTSNSGNTDGECIFISLDFDPESLRENLPDSVVPTWIFFSVLNGVAALPTVLMNILIMWTIIENQRLRNSSYNILLASLAFTDLIVGAVVQPMTVSYLACLVLKCSSPCKTFSGVVIVALVPVYFTLCTLTMLSVERYFAVEHPIYYRRKVTKRKLLLATVILWITFPTTSILSRIFIDNSTADLRKLPTFLFAFFNALVILFCTVKVYVTACRQRRTIATTFAGAQDCLREQQKEYKRSITMAMMVIASVILYSPLIVVLIVETLFGRNVTDSFKYLAQVTSMSFVFFQSLVNPLIFSLRLSYIRKGVKNKLLFFLARDSPSPAVAIISWKSRTS